MRIFQVLPLTLTLLISSVSAHAAPSMNRSAQLAMIDDNTETVLKSGISGWDVNDLIDSVDKMKKEQANNQSTIDNLNRKVSSLETSNNALERKLDELNRKLDTLSSKVK